MISALDILKAKILIVDDNLDNVRLLKLVLGDAGYSSVISTVDPREVYQLHKVNDFDLILLDLLMPGMDGFEVCLAIKRTAATRQVAIIAMTGKFSDGMRQRALDVGALECLPKIGGLDQVPSLIDRAVARPTLW